MSWRYDYPTDRYMGHEYPGVCGNGMHGFTMDELELGARVALSLDDPEQTWWELNGPRIREGLIHAG